jgi:hypothetical protein
MNDEPSALERVLLEFLQAEVEKGMANGDIYSPELVTCLSHLDSIGFLRFCMSNERYRVVRENLLSMRAKAGLASEKIEGDPDALRAGLKIIKREDNC